MKPRIRQGFNREWVLFVAIRADFWGRSYTNQAYAFRSWQGAFDELVRLDLLGDTVREGAL